MSLIEFVNRMLKYRPITFYGADDKYQLFDYTIKKGGFDKVMYTILIISIGRPYIFIEAGLIKNQ